MLFAGDPVEWLLPMPATLVLATLVFWAWRRWWPGSRRGWWLMLLLVGGWLLLGSIPVVGNAWVKALEGEPLSIDQQLAGIGAIDAVLVPGAGGPAIHGRQAVQHQAGYARLLAGVAVWKQTGGELIVMGGLSADPQDSLAAGMRQLAIELGVPPERIRTVGDSATTQQDLQGAARLLAQGRAAGAGGPAGQPLRVVLVTSALHMQRSLATARRLGLAPVAVRCDYRQIANPGWRAWLPNNGAPWQLRSAMHETVGLWVYRLRGWAE